MKATKSQITVANRLLEFNGKSERLTHGATITGTGVLSEIVNTVSNMEQLSRLMPDYFRPFHLPPPTQQIFTPPLIGQQKLF